MKTLRVLTLASAALLSAAPAHAAREIMQATIAGDFNDNPLFEDWVMQIRFDPALGEIVPTEAGNRLVWNSSSGTPSPVFSVIGWANPHSQPPLWMSEDEWLRVKPGTYHVYRLGGFTNVSLEHTAWSYFFHVEGTQGGVSVGHVGLPGYTPPLEDPAGPFDFSSPYEKYFHFTYSDGFGVGTSHTYSVKVEAIMVPEPTTWGLMLLGFGGIGVGLRRVRVVTL